MDTQFPSPYDSQQPSTSSSQQPTPGTSPGWDGVIRSGDCSPFGTLPPHQSYGGGMDGGGGFVPAGEPPSSSILMMEQPTGGRAMLKTIAMRQAHTLNWMGDQYKSPVAIPSSPARTPSVLSCQSEMSAMSAMSGLSTMTGLTVKTVYSETEMDEISQRVLAPPIVTASTSSEPVESEEEATIRSQILPADPSQVFEWVANEGGKYPKWRKMVLRVYAQRDEMVLDKNGQPMPVKLLKALAERFPKRMEEIIGGLMVDMREKTMQERSDTLASLLDCSHLLPHALGDFLRSNIDYLGDIIKCIDHTGPDSNTAAKVLLTISSMPDIRRQARNADTVQRFMSVIHHDKEVYPKKRIVYIEMLKKFLVKSAFVKCGGIELFLDFLNKANDESASSSPVAPNSPLFRRVEKTEPLLYAVMSFLKGLVVSKTPRDLETCVSRMAQRDAVQILSEWLDHGSTRLLHQIAEILSSISASPALIEKDLAPSLRRVIQLLGCDDPMFSYHLTLFVANVSRKSANHKRSAVQAGACRELIQIMGKWCEAMAISKHGGADRAYVHTVCFAMETLALMTERDERTPDVRRLAIEALIRERQAVPILLRLATFDFAYPTVRGTNDVAAKNSAFDTAFDALPFEAKIQEMRCKQYAIKVLQRMCMADGAVQGLAVHDWCDPLHSEKLPIMLWRRMWEMYRLVHLTVMWRRQPQPADFIGRLDNDFAPAVVDLMKTVTQLASVIYHSEKCFVQVLNLVCVPVSAAPNTPSTLNPLRLLSPNMSTVCEAEFSKTMLQHIDTLLTMFQKQSSVSQSFQHPMKAWLVRDENTDFSSMFCRTLQQIVPRYRFEEVAQRLTDAFNACHGNHSPAFTPGGYGSHHHHQYMAAPGMHPTHHYAHHQNQPAPNLVAYHHRPASYMQQ